MNDLKVEQYLNKLERELRIIPALKKSEIILDTKKHIENHMNEGMSLENVFKELGRADQLGQKYLRDLGYLRKKKSNLGKYFIIIVVSFVLILFVAAGTILWKFSPVISMDEQTGRFQFLGGVIDIQTSSSGNVFIKSPDSVGFESEILMDSLSVKLVSIQLQNGFLKLESHNSQNLKYICKADEDYSNLVVLQTDSVVMNWADKGVSCTVFVPINKRVSIVMDNGSVDVDSLKSDLTLKMKAGVVTIDPAFADYNYHLSVVRGLIDPFKNSTKPNAYKIRIDIENGKISKK